MVDRPEGIKITLEDLEHVQVPSASQPIAPAPAGTRAYGTINEASAAIPTAERTRGSLFLQGWFYLGIAGLVGALLGWAVCEPGFVDGAGSHWGNIVMLPALVAAMTLGFGMAESLVERSVQKAALRGALSLPLGAVLGFIFNFLANLVFALGLGACAVAGVQSYRNPLFWIARAIAWAVFGATGGVVYGIIGQSFKKGKFGVLGGILGAGIGGILFDPIAMWTGGPSGRLSRAVGFAIFGLATGAMMGVVESALKDRWFYVTSGPLAGKQFILYKPVTTIGSEQKADIYLFKDPSIAPQHAVLETNGARITLRAAGQVFVGGNPVTNRVLLDNDLIQIGRYAFRYKERSR